MNISQFQQLLEEKGIALSSSQLDQFERYYKILVEWNEKMNLTAITEHGEVYEKHFYDSVSAAFFQDFHSIESVCDVGAGAGFPSIPLKICFPHLHVTIVDSLKKRITFLTHLTEELGLENVSLYHDRAEEFGKKAGIRESFDLVTARAVARISVLNEFCLPLVKENGRFIAMKGSSAPDELKNGEKSFKVLGGKVQKIEHFQLPFEQSERYIVLVDKVTKTPKKYPRKPGMPIKSPLE
ncbi:16S rRNA (guanine(527)-N(7))-methyltransferase RsmG [Priestia flexa]|uniref:Ribosomal RNA small subunit methyltransferase G n=1 Tax=Priestia flexa TaxID=86664 RepID=A0ABU4JAA7_9BACI|nr:16S rRNA (guanine(527)-N(7))-methyltransferase RsmG [Priestia flexa]MCA1203196.1 16S rRNA (guanine(527)-N(7))-methyltransferase RsmG [Priestia flexa]MCG7314504.1 16S rRNA (guanine(527)-N(7))-methyltransferase RsmG [Priestia flexa]MCM3067516.1 16S rRNA (guanine(527)-N(7))-methyltransferase RsmG [Priestia flexa]MDW8517946.1 16S rRNA (guanine(527)-N(7))-methyltransferase RsmG [Priestia flexa]WEZ08839.1 16S rRNA (guanine(527)-N(7))-methyltransferase RsmG [Priestia flexa]